MMQVESSNPLILKNSMDMFFFDVDYEITGKEYDDCSYKLQVVASDAKFYFSWKCSHFEDVFSIAGAQMLEKYFPEMVQEDKPMQGYDLTISYDL